MSIETPAELDGLCAAGKVAAEVLGLMTEVAEPGMTTAELDSIGSGRMRTLGARSAPTLDMGFPAATSVQYEHTIVVTEEGAFVITALEPFLVPSTGGSA